MNLLEVRNLRVWDGRGGSVLVSDSSFQLKKGSCLAIIGESGSGKSLTCRAIMRLNGRGLLQSGEIRFKGVDLNELDEREMRSRRGKQLYMILQNGMRAFDPSSVIGVHLRETLARHYRWNKNETTEKLRQAMQSVRLQDPIGILNKYPHQLSGGMLQRVMIALALLLEPDVILADEPTTALDTVSKFEVVEQFIQLRERTGCSMIFVSHELGVVRKLADEVMVMRAGSVIESGTAAAIFSNARHDYTRYLTSSQRKLNDRFQELMGGAGIADR
ncbi:staphylopine uptake ABC transporter ATP-binding protein CntD [Cohnella thailandensis]|uniref:ABC transporter ATP-binding protein n=1 Tax=Cohnella thailandensis TaxID=557557 RepID=A0A841SQ78_9BACL|nr:ABC transporter ATP-binding protein [Cohnella thailandensis]MBB6633352.1 ABC transporter ATP-binding protein [Cohnella thailandensis]MBP1977306.1 nickel transport system ATP-binding protein [Cohnella thailandensis]